MAFISKSTIQEVNNRLDAVSIIGDYVRLEKKSGRWWGKCPFHAGGQEKTPSFKVDPDLKMYHCFGCSKGGSAISFIMEIDNLTYPEAIKALARKMGIEIVYEEGNDFEVEDTTLKEELFELYKRTTTTFIHFLKEKPEGDECKKYLQERGVNEEMINAFKLGYAPGNRDFLHKFLKQKGYSDEFLEKSGLFSKNYKTISLFSGRLIFPISDRQEKIVAFGGRALPGILQSDGKEPPKYINSPETEIYKKGQTLFAIDLAKQELRRTKTVILAEGYMDVIALHQAGITNAVAPLGTSFTDEQASWLSRWVDKAVLIYDTDEAGVKAAYKSILTCRKYGISCEVVQLSAALQEETGGINTGNFKDPADILLKFGPQMLKNLLKNTIFDFKYIISLSGDKSRMSNFLFPYLEVLNLEVERDDCITQIADVFRIEKKAVQTDYSTWKKKGNIADNRAAKEVPLEVKRNSELMMLTVTAVNMELYPELRAEVQIKEIDYKAAKELFVSLEECFVSGEMNIDSLLARINEDSLKRFILSNGDTPEFKGNNARRLMEDGIKEIKKKRITKRLTEIGAEIRQLERKSGIEANAIDEIDELLSEKKQLDDKLRKII
ncbi:MAG: DNA primase [Treponema sp.]|jgi:DNA primase|nr:DNA primase [Treponema sp.]